LPVKELFLNDVLGSSEKIEGIGADDLSCHCGFSVKSEIYESATHGFLLVDEASDWAHRSLSGRAIFLTLANLDRRKDLIVQYHFFSAHVSNLHMIVGDLTRQA